MMNDAYDSLHPIDIHSAFADRAASATRTLVDVAGVSHQNARRLRHFMRGAKIATHVAFSAAVVSIPGSAHMDFSRAASPPAWAVASFVVGVVGIMAMVFLIPARIIGRVVLFVLGDGSSRADAWFRFGFVLVIIAIAVTGITMSLMGDRLPAHLFTSAMAPPSTIAISP